jgi:environmental stress-induced protein Ves
MALQIITADRFQTTPWKNGGGVTHEIAREERGGRMAWRLSVAEVDTDGPFSRFDGMMRILTVIEGAGLELVTPDGVIAAKPRAPVRFSGDLPVEGRRIDGPVRDLNVIFDPGLIEARVAHLHEADGSAQAATRGRSFALYCLAGEIGLGEGRELRAKSAALFGAPPRFDFAPGAEALLVTLDRLSGEAAG